MIDVDFEKLFRLGIVIALGVTVVGAVHLMLESDAPRNEATTVWHVEKQDNVLISPSNRTDIQSEPGTVLGDASSENVILDEQAAFGKILPADTTASAVVLKENLQNSRSLDDESILLIGSIDGSVTAFSSSVEAELSQRDVSKIHPLWTFQSSPGPLVSSTLSKIELVKNGLPVQLIPSLDGSLFSFNGETIEPLPVSADTLLSSSFKISEDSVVSGGKETVVYGLDPHTGKVKYSCGVGGCISPSAEVPEQVTAGDGGTLLISRLSQSIRAFDVHSGGEKWNFSVGSLDVAMAAGSGGRFAGNVRVCAAAEELVLDDGRHAQFRFDVATGMVVAYSVDGESELWRYQMKHPITSAFLLEKGCVRPLNLVTEVLPLRDPLLLPGDNNQLIYIGFYGEQLYIQRAGTVEDSPLMRRYPQVTFRPLLVNAPSRTPVISEAYRPFLTAALPRPPSPHDKALLPIAPHEYPFDGGYFSAWTDRRPAVGQPRALPAPGDRPPSSALLLQMLQYWHYITGFVVIPVVVAAGLVRWHYKKTIVKMQSETEMLKRQNTSGSSGTLTSVISMQETQMKHSRFRSDFEVIEKLGKGGFGVVYTARNRLDDNLYAVKKIVLPKSDAAREKVRREVRVLAKLDHVSIIRFYNAWVETSDPEPDLPDPDEDLHNRGDQPTCSPTSLSTVDLNCLWIGTQRKKRSLVDVMAGEAEPRDELTDSLRLVPGGEESDVVFEAASGAGGAGESWEVVTSQSDGVVFEEAGGGGGTHRQRKRSRSSTKKSTPSLSGMSELDDSITDEVDGKKAGAVRPLSKPQLFIQMELCRKETLKDWLKSNQERRIRNHVLDIYFQIVSAVEYVHDKGLMHRDLKPSNILFSLDGRAVKVGDFGLVTSLDDEERLRSVVPVEQEKNYLSIHSHTNQVGTSLYMSPELVQGKCYDEKVDMYSLGLILFELLLPFHTEMERVYCMRAAKNLTFDAIKTSLSCSLPSDEPVLRRLLASDPRERPSASVLRMGDLFRGLVGLMEGTAMRGRGQSVSLADFFEKK